MTSEKEPWRESLFDICASPSLFCKAFCCFECLFGQNAAHIANVSCFVYCCVYSMLFSCCLCGLVHKPIRIKIREKYHLQEEPTDCLATYLLSPFAICQETREIMSREKFPNAKVRINQPIKTVTSPNDSEVASATSSTNDS